MGVVVGQVVGHAGEAGVHIAAAEVLGRHHFAGGGLHQGRAAQEDGALVLHDDGFIAHGRHIGAACRARAHHHRNLRNALGRKIGLVEEDAAEVIAVGENFVLVRQVGAAAVHQVDARQAVLLRDLLRPQVLLDGERVVGAALHGGVVADHHALHACDPADAGNHAGGWGRVAAVLLLVNIQRRQGADFQERGVRVQEHGHAVARQQLAARHVFGARRLATAFSDAGKLGTQVVNKTAHDERGGLEIGRAGVELADQVGHSESFWDGKSGRHSRAAAENLRERLGVASRSKRLCQLSARQGLGRLHAHELAGQVHLHLHPQGLQSLGHSSYAMPAADAGHMKAVFNSVHAAIVSRRSFLHSLHGLHFAAHCRHALRGLRRPR